MPKSGKVKALNGQGARHAAATAKSGKEQGSRIDPGRQARIGHDSIGCHFGRETNDRWCPLFPRIMASLPGTYSCARAIEYAEKRLSCDTARCDGIGPQMRNYCCRRMKHASKAVSADSGKAPKRATMHCPQPLIGRTLLRAFAKNRCCRFFTNCDVAV